MKKVSEPGRAGDWRNRNGWHPTWDVVAGDTIRFEEAVFDGSAKPNFLGNRTIIADVRRDSYGAAKQQHTFTLQVLDASGREADKYLVGTVTTRKGRNVYRHGVERLPWADEAQRAMVADEKHVRGNAARMAREWRYLEGGVQ